jgi:hypothetical protein
VSLKAIKGLFWVAAVYDLVLGFVFWMFFPLIYGYFGLELPNHPGYVQLSAIFIFIIGFGFFLVTRDPVGNRQIVLLGILMKLGYCLVVFSYLFYKTVPPIYVPFAILDLLFLALFLPAYGALAKMAAPTKAGVKNT